MIAYSSMEEDGYELDLNRLFVYNVATGERKWISEGWDYDVETVQWNGNGSIWFTSSFRGTKPVFNINLADGKITRVTEGNYDMGPLQLQNGVLVAGVMSMSLATEVALVNMATGEFKMITDVNGHIYESIKIGKTEEKYIKTKDNKDLQMWVIYPPDFDPSKKYPALLFCEGGPSVCTRSVLVIPLEFSDYGCKRVCNLCSQQAWCCRIWTGMEGTDFR